MLDALAGVTERPFSPINHVLLTHHDLKPVTSYIMSQIPNPKPQTPNFEWSPVKNSLVFKKDDFWVVRRNRTDAQTRNQTDLYVRDDGKLLYVLWRELDDNPINVSQLTAVITETEIPGQGKTMICFDGEQKQTSPGTTLNYINTLLTEAFNTWPKPA